MYIAHLAELEQADVAHHCAHHGALGQLILADEIAGEYCQQHIAVHHFAPFVHGDDAVGVTVKGDAQVIAAFHHPGTELLDVGAAAVHIDIDAVRGVVDDAEVRPDGCEELPGGGAGCAVGTVHQHPDALGPCRGSGGQILHIVGSGIVVHPDASEVLSVHQRIHPQVVQDQFLDLLLIAVGEFIALGIKELDAVVLIGIVTGGDDKGSVRLIFPGQIGHARCGDHAQQGHISAHRAESCRNGALQHAAGDPGVPPDEKMRVGIAPLLDNRCRCTAQIQCQFRCHIHTGYAPDSVCPENSAHTNRSFQNSFCGLCVTGR